MDYTFEVKQAQKGNKDAFVRLINSTEKSMYRVARSILDSDQDCADAIQESILNAYYSLKSLREPGLFKTWLIRILINECKKIRKLRVKVVPIPELIKQVTKTDDYSNIEWLEIVNLLEADLRIIVILFYFEDLSVHSISALLRIPEGTVKSRLSRARIKLSEAFNDRNERGSFHGRN